MAAAGHAGHPRPRPARRAARRHPAVPDLLRDLRGRAQEAARPDQGLSPRCGGPATAVSVSGECSAAVEKTGGRTVPVQGSTPSLLGRPGEQETLRRLVANVRGGQSAVLVLRGEAGIGKTELLRDLISQATGFTVARAVGVESEMELVFAGLHQLCAPMLGRLRSLAAPQRRALSVAFGLAAGDNPDRFLVALAALSLMAETSEKRPLLCVVDDAQWLDRASAQVLGFVGRRLLVESIALVFGARQPGRELLGLPELAVSGLPAADARALLDSATPSRLDGRIRDRIVVETRGNPLALLELPRGLTATQMAGGLGLVQSG